MNQPRGVVLVVDEDKDAVERYRETLSTAGYRVVSAGDGREAIARVEENLPDAIVSEMALPNASGLYLLMGIRTRPPTQSIPFIAATSIPRDSEIWTEIDPQWNVYMPKPIDLGELVATIDRLIDRTITIDEPVVDVPVVEISLVEEPAAAVATGEAIIAKPARRRAPKKKPSTP